MATANGIVFISGAQAIDENRRTVQVMGLVSSETVDGTSSSALSSMFTENRIIRVASLGDVYLKAGSNVTAVAGSDALLPGGTIEYFKIGSNEQIAVIGDEANITIMN